MKNAVIYARFSSHSQTEQSIEGQLKECYEYAKRNKYDVVGEYIDRALTGTSDKRPMFKQMINDSKKETFQFVIVYQLDRFARNRYDSATYKNILNKNGVRVVSAKENISNDASGILVEAVLEGMAEYYSVELSQKVKRGQTISAEKCRFLGGVIPFGYKINLDSKLYEIDERTAPYVSKIFNMYVEGNSIQQICNYLNNKKILTTKNCLWNKNSLHHLLSNKKYLGYYTYNDKVIQGGVPQLINVSLFESAARRKIMNKKANRNQDNNFILTGKVFCGVCHSTIIGESGTSKNGNVHYYYKCASRKRKLNNCDLRIIQKDLLETLVLDKIKSVLSDINTINEISKNLEKYNKKFENDDKEHENSLKNQLKDCEKAIKNFMSAIENGIFTPGTKDRLLELENEKDDLNNRLGFIELCKSSMTADKITYWISKQLTKCQTNDDKQLIIDIFVNKIIVYPNEIVVILNYSDETKNNQVKIEDLSDIMDEIKDTSKQDCSTVSVLVTRRRIELLIQP